MTPFRTNARPADPQPEDDTSDAWFAKLRADTARRARLREVGTLFAVLGLVLVAVLGIVATQAWQTEQMRKCEVMGGTWVRGQCLAVRELHP